MTAPDPTTDVLLAEYEALKKEQAARISQRDNLIYATIGVIAGAVYAATQTHQLALLLAIQPVCFLLGWTYLTNDVAVSAIGRYIWDELSIRVSTTDAFAWEYSHAGDGRRRQRKAIQLAVDLGLFCGAGLAGTVAYLAASLAGRPHPVLLAAAALNIAAAVVLGWQIVAYADLRATGSRRAA